MIKFIFSKEGKKLFIKLPEIVQKRIFFKITLLKEHSNIFSVTKRLENFAPATHRLRIGSYRVILELKKHSKTETKFLILSVMHRKEIYKKS